MGLVQTLALSWAVNAAILLLLTLILDDVTTDGAGPLLIAGAVFGALNTFVKPLLKLVTLPLAVITLGLIQFPIAMAMLGLTSALVDGFAVKGLGTLIVATIVVWLLNMAMDAGGWMLSKRPAGARAI